MVQNQFFDDIDMFWMRYFVFIHKQQQKEDIET
jgi:hypothetical protein